MHVTILGKRYRLLFTRMRGIDGRCQAPGEKDKIIEINPKVRRNDRLYMETVLHELLHAAGWHLDEQYVTRYSHDAARILYRLGFRNAENSDNSTH